jgi:ferredoxin-NADP reductase
VPGFETRLIKREEVARQTVAFHFDKPQAFCFQPGQYAELTLIDPDETDKEGNTRTFSIASDPGAESLTFVTRVRDSAFKRALMALPISAAVRLDGPYGAFCIQEAPPPRIVLIAGGIGITPFLSILKHGVRRGSLRDTLLFYSNRDQADAAFLDELLRLELESAGFRFVPTLTGGVAIGQSWRGETGRIDGRMLGRHVDTPDAAAYYVSGPGAMVAAMRRVLMGLGVPRRSIRFETFLGY